MDPEVQSLIEDYYKVLGIKPSKSRKTEQVQARAAIMVALRRHRTTVHLGKVFDCSHCTIVHHCQKHADNMLTWAGYNNKYKVAENMCSMLFKNKSLEGRLKHIQWQIKRLSSVEKSLIETIKIKSFNYEQLQVQDN